MLAEADPMKGAFVCHGAVHMTSVCGKINGKFFGNTLAQDLPRKPVLQLNPRHNDGFIKGIIH